LMRNWRQLSCKPRNCRKTYFCGGIFRRRRFSQTVWRPYL